MMSFVLKEVPNIRSWRNKLNKLVDRPHYAYWPARLTRQLSLPVTSLWDNLETSARRHPNKAAIVFLGQVITYQELEAKSLALAAQLHQLGVSHGDRVVLNMQNCPQLVIAHFAILRANAVVVPVNPMNRSQELQHYITDPDTRVAFTTADLAKELAQASNSLTSEQRLKHLIVTHFTDEFVLDSNESNTLPQTWQDWLLTAHDFPELEGGQIIDWKQACSFTDKPPKLTVAGDDLAVLPYTSGTTGLPKGCMHTHSSIMHNAIASGLWGNGSADNMVLAVVPMFHITGLVSVMHTSIRLGATMILMPRWDRELAGQLISKFSVTHWTNIPTMVIDLLGSPNINSFNLSSLVYIGGGGAAMPQAVAQRLWETYGLRYIEGYGLTETAGPSHTNPPEFSKQQCLGIPYISTDSRIIDPEFLHELGVGEQGEIIMRGPEVFQGYWKRPDATEAAFVMVDGLRFFRSGDLGHVDDQGYFFLTDRLKRMINASGFKVWPAEVEALLFNHPAIQEACIISTKDSYRGESVKAVVVLRENFQGKVSEQDILSWCRDHMAVYKAPRFVEFIYALPKSGSGKVMWRALQDAEHQK